MGLPTPNLPIQSQSAALMQRNYQVNSDANSIKDLAYKAFVVCHDEEILIDAWLPEQVQLDVHADYDAPFAQGVGSDSDIGKVAKMAGISMTTQALTVQVWQGGTNLQFSLPFIFQAYSSGDEDVMTPIKKLLRLMMPKEPTKGGLLTAPGPHIDKNKALENNLLTTIAGAGIVGGAAGAAGAAGVVAGTVGNLVSMGNWQGASNFASNSANWGLKNVSEQAAKVSEGIINSITNNISLYVGQFLYFPSVVITDVSPTFDVVLGPDKNPIRASVIVQFKTFYVPTQNDLDAMFPQSAPTGDNGYSGVAANSATNPRSRR